MDDQQIENVIRYYRLFERVAQFIVDLRSEQFKSLSPQRKTSLFRTYIEMDKTLVLYGLDALKSLGDQSAAERARNFNIRGQAHSDRAEGG